MRHSTEKITEAIEYFKPSLKVLRESGVTFSVYESLKSAAESALRGLLESTAYMASTEISEHAEVIIETLEDIRFKHEKIISGVQV